MVIEPGWLSVLPPVAAIVLAIVTRQVYLSLFVGIWLGWTMLAGGDPLTGLADALEACVAVFGDAGNTRVIAFSALVGALIVFTQYSGGVAGFVEIVQKRQLATTPRRARLLSFALGTLIFVESSVTSLINGAVCRPLFDRLRISREKLAYLCDSTAAPICILIPLNGWGAYILRELDKAGYERPVEALLASLPWNFYAIVSLVIAFMVAWSGRALGPMAAAEARVRETGAALPPNAEPVVSEDIMETTPPPGTTPRASNFLIPIGVMVAMMPIGLLVTGNGDMMAGSGSKSVLWAVLAGTVVAAGMGMARRVFGLREATSLFFKGFGGLMPLALLLVLALAISATTKQLGTGDYLAGLASGVLSPHFVPLIVFALSCVIAFSTGTSWGTFGIMLPLAIPLAATVGAAEPVAIAAVLGGGVFGDHCSPISDTTIIASMSAGCDHVDHVRTQLPYALAAAAVTAALYAVIGG